MIQVANKSAVSDSPEASRVGFGVRCLKKGMRMANIKCKSSMAGTGCLLQFLGLASLLVGLITIMTVIGPIILWPLGVWFVFFGSRKASWHECSACGSRLTGKKLEMCPNCNSKFE